MKRLFAFVLTVLWAPAALADYEAAAEYSAQFRGISFLVIEDGEVVFEDYPGDGAADRGHPLASGTKSFTGIIAAAAVQDGLLHLDEKVSDTITEWQGTLRENITVRQLLHLTAGLPPSRRAGGMPPYRVAIRADIVAPPGGSFIYGPVPFQVFGELMKRKLGRDPVDYLTERVLDPIGLEVHRWRRDRRGDSMLSAGAYLTARNWARLGEFLLAHGEWNGEPLVSRQAFDELFVGSQINPAYGLSWWLINPVNPVFAAQTPPMSDNTDFWQYPEVFPEDMVMAAGAGDQRLYVSWERGIVVVRQAEGIMGALLGVSLSWSDVQFWRLLDAPAGERPEALPPLEVELPERNVRRGADVELPSGGMVQLPPLPQSEGARDGDSEEGGGNGAEEDSDSEEGGDEDETGEDDFVGPTY